MDSIRFDDMDWTHAAPERFRAVEVKHPEGYDIQCVIKIRTDGLADPVPDWQRDLYEANMRTAVEIRDRRWIEAGGDPEQSPSRIAERERITKARKKKAEALVKVLAEHGIGVEDARIMNDGHWKMAAKAAAVHLPSAETRLMVIGMLAEHAKAKPEAANAA